MAETAYVPRLRTQYEDQIKADLLKQFGYKNVMQLPKLEKIVLNMGVGEAVNDSKKVKAAAAALEKIAGQRPGIFAQGRIVANNLPIAGIGIDATVRADIYNCGTGRQITVHPGYQRLAVQRQQAFFNRLATVCLHAARLTPGQHQPADCLLAYRCVPAQSLAGRRR